MPSGDDSLDRPPVTDEWCAAILAAGLRLGVVDTDAVIAWADCEIERRQDVPAWLIDLSLSKPRHILDVIGMLAEVGRGVDGRSVLVGVCSLLPNLTGYDFEQCEALAGRLYRTAYDLLAGDWSCDLLYEADAAEDAFQLQRDGLIRATPDQVVADFRAFVDRLRDEAVRRRLDPVRLIIRSPETGS